MWTLLTACDEQLGGYIPKNRPFFTARTRIVGPLPKNQILKEIAATKLVIGQPQLY
jgi:hypothetical protein